ncbi:MAG: SGNH/GDSL hydrolase family protein [bacterium]|nr:SGNH/GDSL hydrolase family protein [bacterium]
MKKKLLAILTFCVVLAVSMGVLEILLRYAEISLPSIIRSHPKLGRVFKPNAKVMILNEGFYMGHINKYGYTGPAYPPERTTNAFRIALVGDSYVQGHYMDTKYYFGTILEKKLSNFLKRDVEVMNMGIAGSDFQRMYIRYQNMVKEFQPDATIFVIGPGDLLKRDRNLGAVCKMENGALKINYDFAQSKQYKLKTKFEFMRAFGFYPLAQKAYALYRSGNSADILLGKMNPFKSKEKRKPYAGDDFPPRSDDRYYDLNLAILKTLHAFNTGESKIPGGRPTRNIIVLKHDIPPYYLQAATEMGMDVVNLTPELDEMRKQGMEPHYWEATKKMGHWNHDAHHMVGEFLARTFARNPYFRRTQ